MAANGSATTGFLANQTVNDTLEQAVLAHLPEMSPLASFAVILGATFVLAKLIQVGGSRLARRLLARTDSDLDDIVFEEVHAPIYITVTVIGAYAALLPLGLSQDLNYWARATALSLITIIWGLAFIRGGNRFFEKVKERDQGSDVAHIFDNIWTFLIAIVALFTMLSIWNIDITPLLASAGVAGVVIGFAAKDAVANLFGGFALFFDDTYKVGDYIVLDSGDAGTVVDIGIRSTTMITRDEVTVTVPNAVLNSAKVINESSPKERKRISVPIGVAYGTDVDAFEDAVLEEAKEQDLVMDHPRPRMRFREFGDSSLQYDLLCWVEAPLQDKKAQHELNRQIYKRLNREDIEIPYPKRDVYMRQDAVEQARHQERIQAEEGAADVDEISEETGSEDA